MKASRTALSILLVAIAATCFYNGLHHVLQQTFDAAAPLTVSTTPPTGAD